MSQASLAEMHTYLDTVTYGLGVSRQTLAGNIVLGHTGSIRGYESIVLYVPSIDVGLAVLVNQGPSEPVAIAARLVDILTQETSVNEHDVQTMELCVMPNPSAGECTIRGLRGGERIFLVDLAGTVYREFTATDKSAHIDLHSAPSGLYQLVVADGTSRRSHEVIIQR